MKSETKEFLQPLGGLLFLAIVIFGAAAYAIIHNDQAFSVCDQSLTPIQCVMLEYRKLK